MTLQHCAVYRRGCRLASLESLRECARMLGDGDEHDDDRETTHVDEILIFQGPDFVITVRCDSTEAIRKAQERLESDPELLAHGPAAVHCAIVDEVVDEYFPILDGVRTTWTMRCSSKSSPEGSPPGPRSSWRPR